VAAGDGWTSVIYGCKKGWKSRRLDKDKKWDSKEKKAS